MRGDKSAREALVKLHLSLVENIAKSFLGRGEPFDDLVQVGCVGLVKAIDRFDLGRGLNFSAYAAPTIRGEIKRYFRDDVWSIHVSRGIKALNADIEDARRQLTREGVSSPTVEQLADALGIPPLTVGRALVAWKSKEPVSIDGCWESGSEESLSILETTDVYDSGYGCVEFWSQLRSALVYLTRPEKEILYWYLFEEIPQTEIAGKMGISQMHVSRQLRSAISEIRKQFTLGGWDVGLVG